VMDEIEEDKNPIKNGIKEGADRQEAVFLHNDSNPHASNENDDDNNDIDDNKDDDDNNDNTDNDTNNNTEDNDNWDNSNDDNSNNSNSSSKKLNFDIIKSDGIAQSPKDFPNLPDFYISKSPQNNHKNNTLQNPINIPVPINSIGNSLTDQSSIYWGASSHYPQIAHFHSVNNPRNSAIMNAINSPTNSVPIKSPIHIDSIKEKSHSGKGSPGPLNSPLSSVNALNSPLPKPYQTPYLTSPWALNSDKSIEVRVRVQFFTIALTL
jgi:hypothetical protein